MDSIEFLILAFLLIGIGFIFCFRGKALFRPLLAVIGFIFGMILTQSVLSQTVENQTMLWVITVIAGVFFAFLTTFIYSFGVFFTGFISVLLFLDSYGASFGAQEWNIFIKLLLCIAGGFAALFFQKVVISVISAFIGGYLITSNAWFILDLFRYKKSITSITEYNDYFQNVVITSDGSVALVVIAVLAIAGVLVQWKILRKR